MVLKISDTGCGIWDRGLGIKGLVIMNKEWGTKNKEGGLRKKG